MTAFSTSRSGLAVQQLADGLLAQAARVAGVPVEELGVPLVAGDGDLAGVDDDDEVAGVDMRGVDRLVLAPQQLRGLAGQPAEHDVGRVDHVPGVGHIAGLGAVRAHGYASSLSSSCSGPGAAAPFRCRLRGPTTPEIPVASGPGLSVPTASRTRDVRRTSAARHTAVQSTPPSRPRSKSGPVGERPARQDDPDPESPANHARASATAACVDRPSTSVAGKMVIFLRTSDCWLCGTGAPSLRRRRTGRAGRRRR